MESLYQKMAAEGENALIEEGVAADKIVLERSLDLRYLGQSYTLKIPADPLEQVKIAFHESHQSRYGHSLELPVELVNLRLSVSGEMPQPMLAKLKSRGEALPVGTGEMAVYKREQLLAGDKIKGPAIITEKVATTFVAKGWRCEVDEMGNLLLKWVV
jgi:N-methylhydantoinase A